MTTATPLATALSQGALASGFATAELHHLMGQDHGDPFTVQLVRSGKSISVDPGETILKALRREGLEIESSCQNGVCGTCVTRLLEGKADHRDMVLTAAEKIAVCCSRSQTPGLVLNV